MASEMEVGLRGPVRGGPCRYLLNTEAQAREAFYSHESLIRQGGRFGVVGPRAPAFTWTPSATFGRPLKVPEVGGVMRATRTVTTTCLRTEFVMVAYAYVVEVLRNVLREYRAFVERLGDPGNIKQHDHDEARDFCKRLYEVYLILVDRVKVHVLLHTIGNVAPACAELSMHTVNALIAYVVGLHAVVMFTFYEINEIMHKRGEPVSFATRRNVFRFAARQFLRAYSIFTLYVWPEYSADSQEQARFQRYLLGAALFYEARAIVCAIRQEKTSAQWSPAAVLVLARRADYLLGILSASAAFGFRTGAERLRRYTDVWISSMHGAVAANFPHRAKITSVQQYRGGDQFTNLIYSDKTMQGMLRLHHKKQGRFFRSDPIHCSVPRGCLFQDAQ